VTTLNEVPPARATRGVGIGARKKALLAKLRVLLDVQRVETPWEEVLSPRLYQWPLRDLNALLYRVERARAESYEEGERSR